MPSETQKTGRAYEFGPFKVQGEPTTLLKNGVAVHIGGRTLKLLLTLLTRAGEVISKEELIGAIWPHANVEETALRAHISVLRKVLGDGQEGCRYIINVPQRGYSFAASLKNSSIDGRLQRRNEAVIHSFHELPTPLPDIVGRDALLSRLPYDIFRRRCLTIVGSGGMGKTTVAIALANRVQTEFSDGVCFLDLSAVSDGRTLPTVLGIALGIDTSDNELVISVLSKKNMLIVADSCEHLIESAAMLFSEILSRTPYVRILATSREPLRVHEEGVHYLAPLFLPTATGCSSVEDIDDYPATKFFVQRCVASTRGFTLCQADVPVVVDICRRLDGIPLALELAAEQVSKFGIHQSSVALDDWLCGLQNNLDDMSNGDCSTFMTTLDWSYNLLNEYEKLIFCQLSQFSDSFTEEDALEICGAEAQEVLSNLIEKCLIVVDLSDADAKYRLLETAKIYCRHKIKVGAIQ